MTFPVKEPYNITTTFSPAHLGIDIAPIPAGSKGIPCVAPENGIIIESTQLPVEGNYVKMRGDSGMFYYFGHFSNRLVGVGARVGEGQPVGILGMTGQATGIHTHHEVRTTSTGGQLDPLVYYKEVQGDTMSTIGEVEFNYLFFNFFGDKVQPTEGDRKRWIGAETNTAIRQMQADPRQPDYDKYVKDLEKAVQSGNPAPPSNFKPYSGDTLYILNKEA